jgi:hypothetical protein
MIMKTAARTVTSLLLVLLLAVGCEAEVSTDRLTLGMKFLVPECHDRVTGLMLPSFTRQDKV